MLRWSVLFFYVPDRLKHFGWELGYRLSFAGERMQLFRIGIVYPDCAYTDRAYL